MKTPQSAKMSDSEKGEDRRRRTLTEAGQRQYQAQREQHWASENAVIEKIQTQVQAIPAHREDQAGLEEIRDKITKLVSAHEDLVHDCLEFLKRTNTAESLEDCASFKTKVQQHRNEIEQAFGQIDERLASLRKLPSNHQKNNGGDSAPSVVSSSTSRATSKQRAKLEAAKTRLLFVKKEVELKKRQAALEAELDILNCEKEVAVAEAEAEAMEDCSKHSSSSARSARDVLSGLPAQSAKDRTATYVQEHGTPENTRSTLNPNAMPFDWTTLLLKKELLLNRISNFNDSPETYISWKESFSRTIRQLALTPAEEVDLLIKHLGSESKKQAVSIKSANPRSSENALRRIWERLDNRYGTPEMVEAAMKKKLSAFPKLSANPRDNAKLYELGDLLTELESLKEDPDYSLSLSYFDTPGGVNPIIAKLPHALQERWTMHAVRYNAQHGVRFPPFAELARYVREQSEIRNNPCFRYDAPPASCAPGNTGKGDKQRIQPTVSVRKTEVANNESPGTSTEDKPRCPIHKTRHALTDCKGFRAKPIWERRTFLKKNGGCFRCCQLGHMRQDCKTEVLCECGSNAHHTALHDDGEESRSTHQETEKTESVSTKCTQICGSCTVGKSCAKLLLVSVYPEGNPEKALRAYAIIDDQSNRSLAKSELFNTLGIHGEEYEYTLSSCHGRTRITGRKANGLHIESINGTARYKLPPLIECDDIPSSRAEIPTPEVARCYTHLQDIESHMAPVDSNAEILLLIGRDIPEAHHVLEQRTGPQGTPYAQRLSLGWVVIGESCLGRVHSPDTQLNVKKTSILPGGRPSLLLPCPNTLDVREGSPTNEFKTSIDVFARTKDDDKPGMSQEDRKFLELMDTEFTRDEDGTWAAPLPFREERPRLPNNKAQAIKRASTLASSLRRDPLKKLHFATFMEGIFEAGHAEIAPPLRDDQECWYLPIFGVYHPKKPDRIRGVFDSSAQFKGVSLNDVLMSGPDQTNNLLGVLLRFRQEAVAVMADIKQMFYCFRVKKEHRDFLRFLWFEDNDPEKPLVEYRMRVHVFGNTSSPAVATYGLRKTSAMMKEKFGIDVNRFVTENFYVDDGLASLPTPKDAVDLLSKTQQALLEGGGIRLHKFASNSPDVMAAFPKDDLAGSLQDFDLTRNGPTMQRSLGVSWDIQTDMFTFHVNEEEKANTRRGVLSTVHAIYDPLGFLAPVTIEGKLILRDLVAATTDWDTPMPDETLSHWQRWKASLVPLQNLQVPRMYRQSLPPVNRRELHIFADASEKAIASVAYLKTTSPESEQISFVLGKAKVAPKHALTMPRLELCAALLASEMGSFIHDNLDFIISATTYYSDSKVVLGYLNNRTRRFYTYVANRVQQILRLTEPEQWTYVSTHLNPADTGTRAVPAGQLADSAWLQGPDFLRSRQSHVDMMPKPAEYPLTEDDVEVRPEVRALKTHVSNDSFGVMRFARFSTWTSLVKAIANLTRLAATFAGRKRDTEDLHASELERAKKLIIRETQRNTFEDEIGNLQAGSEVSRTSPLAKLDPFMDEDGMLRIGGRLRASNLGPEEKHPLIIDRTDHIATLLVRHFHAEVKHQGRHMTEGTVRAAGYWIIGGKRLVASVIYQCVTCRKLRRNTSTQKMADLPADRLELSPPFTNVGVDVFGPWEVMTRRTRGGIASSKRWAVMFSCLSTRAVHIEVVEEMSTSSFINALRRLYALRGPAKTLRSDCGSNFKGFANLSYLAQNGTTWIFNPPHASHMGGSWERMIGIARRIFNAMMLQMSNPRLTHEVLVTFMAEVCAIMNARPLTTVSTDPENPELLSPNMLLTQKIVETVNFEFDDKDMYRAQWRRVQVLAEMFWKKWRQEYLASLQARRKWTSPQRNIKKGDIVLMKDRDVARNVWPMALVTGTAESDDGLTRKVHLKAWRDGQPHTFERPVTEVVVLIET